MAENIIEGTPVTIVFTLIISFLGFFAVVTCVTLYFYKRRTRRLEHIQQGTGGRGTLILGANWSERPAIWEVWADKHPKPTSTWDDLLPLNLTYDRDQHPSPVLPASRRRRILGGITNSQPPPAESSNGPQSNLATTDCNVSLFIAMPTPHKHPAAEFGGEFAIGTAEVVYRHPERSHS